MEPFDYPDNDPGPQTLLTSLTAEQNIDRLHWYEPLPGLCRRHQPDGRALHRAEQALAPVLREAGKRGLIYFDDGSSPRSIASQIAGAHNVAFAKADAVLDAVPTAADDRQCACAARGDRARARHRGRRGERAAGHDRPHRQLGKTADARGITAGADQRGREPPADRQRDRRQRTDQSSGLTPCVICPL